MQTLELIHTPHCVVSAPSAQLVEPSCRDMFTGAFAAAGGAFVGLTMNMIQPGKDLVKACIDMGMDHCTFIFRNMLNDHKHNSWMIGKKAINGSRIAENLKF